jgi:hypothetical protein
VLDQRSVAGHRPLNDPRELPAVILDLLFERRDARLSSTQRRPITLEHLERREQMIPRVGECPLALARRGLKLLLPHLEGLGSHPVLDSDLLQPLARRIVVVLGGLRGQRKRSLPDGFHGLDNFRRCGFSFKVSFFTLRMSLKKNHDLRPMTAGIRAPTYWSCGSPTFLDLSAMA